MNLYPTVLLALRQTEEHDIVASIFFFLHSISGFETEFWTEIHSSTVYPVFKNSFEAAIFAFRSAHARINIISAINTCIWCLQTGQINYRIRTISNTLLFAHTHKIFSGFSRLLDWDWLMIYGCFKCNRNHQEKKHVNIGLINWLSNELFVNKGWHSIWNEHCFSKVSWFVDWEIAQQWTCTDTTQKTWIINWLIDWLTE